MNIPWTQPLHNLFIHLIGLECDVRLDDVAVTSSNFLFYPSGREASYCTHANRLKVEQPSLPKLLFGRLFVLCSVDVPNNLARRAQVFRLARNPKGEKISWTEFVRGVRLFRWLWCSHRHRHPWYYVIPHFWVVQFPLRPMQGSPINCLSKCRRYLW